MKFRIAFLLLLFSTTIQAAKLNVCSTCNFKSIKSALKAASANDSIFINNGTYKEGNIIIDKPLYIKGIGWPRLEGEGKLEIFTVKASNTYISGIHFNQSGTSSLHDLAAVKLLNVKNVSVHSNKLTNNYFGIYLANSSDCSIVNNRISATGTGQQSSGNGIHLWKSSKSIIKGNDISGHRDGIYFEFVTETKIIKNISQNNLRYGLHFMFSNDDTYEGNVFKNNGAGVAVMYSSRVSMKNNVFELNWGSGSYGILLKDIRDSQITGNTFKENSTAIFAESVSRIDVIGNIFIKNGWAIKLTSSSDGLNISGNNFILNTFDMATNGTGNVTVNTFNNNYWDKYKGYDLDRNGIGDVPFYPVSLSTLLVEKIPSSVFFLHSFVLDLIDQSEKLIPQLIPISILDESPSMKKIKL